MRNILSLQLNGTRMHVIEFLQIQDSARPEVHKGQLNPMAEPIPHEVRPLVRTHVYHPYQAADRQAETDS